MAKDREVVGLRTGEYKSVGADLTIRKTSEGSVEVAVSRPDETTLTWVFTSEGVFQSIGAKAEHPPAVPTKPAPGPTVHTCQHIIPDYAGAAVFMLTFESGEDFLLCPECADIHAMISAVVNPATISRELFERLKRRVHVISTTGKNLLVLCPNRWDK